MRKMLFLLLLFPLFLHAQRPEYERAFFKSIPDSLTRPIHMPERDYNPNFNFDYTIDYRQKNNRVVVITSDSVYRKLFWRYVYTQDSIRKYTKLKTEPYYLNWMKEHLVDSLLVIDFSTQELVMYSACAQCLAFCNHDEGRTSCHRNACNFREAWFIREKKERNIAQMNKE